MTTIRRIVKFTLFVFFVCVFFITNFPIVLYMKFNLMRGRKMLLPFIRFYAKLAVFVFGVKVNVRGEIPKDENFLVVCNHLCYLDMFIISSYIDLNYITSIELKKTPFLGEISMGAGCLYVDRRSTSNIGNEIADIKNGLEQGFNVAFFPEAKSTNGEKVIMFRRSLFRASLETNKRVLPICLNYTSKDGVPITVENRDELFWYDDMTFFPHLWPFLGTKTVEVTVDFLPPISPKDRDVTKLANDAHTAVSAKYVNIV